MILSNLVKKDSSLSWNGPQSIFQTISSYGTHHHLPPHGIRPAIWANFGKIRPILGEFFNIRPLVGEFPKFAGGVRYYLRFFAHRWANFFREGEFAQGEFQQGEFWMGEF